MKNKIWIIKQIEHECDAKNTEWTVCTHTHTQSVIAALTILISFYWCDDLARMYHVYRRAFVAWLICLLAHIIYSIAFIFGTLPPSSWSRCAMRCSNYNACDKSQTARSAPKCISPNSSAAAPKEKETSFYFMVLLRSVIILHGATVISTMTSTAALCD